MKPRLRGKRSHTLTPQQILKAVSCPLSAVASTLSAISAFLAFRPHQLLEVTTSARGRF